ELTFEIDRPDLVRSGGVQRDRPRVLPMRPRATTTHTIVSRENIEDRTACGPRAFGVARLQALQDLARAPAKARMLVENQLHNFVGRFRWRRQRRTTVLH